MGNNSSGQLGDGSTANRPIPVLIATDVISVSAGASHSLFIKTDGSLWAMGRNSSGQFGDGSTTSHTTPVQIAVSAAAASAGGSHTLILYAPGTLPADFAAWAEAAGLSGAGAAPDADPDADGLPNLLEYVFASSPAQASPASVRSSAEVQSVDGQSYLVFTHRRRKSAAASCVYQTSTDLVSWSSITVVPIIIDPDVAGDGLAELVSVAIPFDGRSRLFLRLSVAP